MNKMIVLLIFFNYIVNNIKHMLHNPFINPLKFTAMKKLFLLRKSLFIAFAATTCGLFSIIGCAAQKPAAGRQGEAAGGEIRHAQASKALEEGRFVIEANEFYLPEDKSPVKSSTGNYISMEGKRGVISFTPDLFPKTPLGNLTITDDSAEITLEKRKKNGDMQFCMRMTGPANSQDRKVIITLYKDCLLYTSPSPRDCS